MKPVLTLTALTVAGLAAGAAATAVLAGGPLLTAGTPSPSLPPRPVFATVAPPSQRGLGPLTTPTPGFPSPIEAIDFDGNGANNAGYYSIPPDPIGAASASHLVNIVNTSIEWYRRSDGAREHSELIGYTEISGVSGFFAPLTPANLLFDPKVTYDQYAGRFVVVALEQVEAGTNPSAGNTSRILLAVSDDSDPNGTWCFQTIDSKLNLSGTEYWADYPGLAVDGQAVYVTSNLFAFSPQGAYAGPRLWILDKGAAGGGLYDCGTSSVNAYDPGGYKTTTQPAHVYGANGVPGAGTFLVKYDGLSGGTDQYLQITRVADPLGTPVFTSQFLNVGHIDNTASDMPGAPQSGTSDLIDTNDRRALNAVWRDGSLWLTAQVVPAAGADAGQATAHWWQVDTAAAPAGYTLVQQGNVGGEDVAAGAYTFFPSIAVNANGAATIGFSVSASSIFAGAAYTWREVGDAVGTVQESVVYAAGLGPYLRTFGGSNRWGDYSGAAVDADDLHFCFYNQYAQTPGTEIAGEDGRWGTRWACTLPAIDQADLSITKTDNPDPVVAGNPLVYTVTVTNLGPSNAQGVSVSDILPPGVTLISTNGCVNDLIGAPICSLGLIPAGAGKTYRVVVAVNINTPAGVIRNAATVGSATNDPVAGNNTDTEDTQVLAPPVRPCDADRDGDIDRSDLGIISKARGQTASGPDDPRDGNHDGRITTGDVKVCTPLCTLPGCAILP